MKKTICLLCIVIALFGFISHAFAKSYTSFGIKGGLNVSNIQGDDWGESDPLIGACVGLFTTIGVNQGLAKK